MSHAPLVLSYDAELQDLNIAIAALMTRFYINGCPGIAGGVIQHLQSLLEHPQVQASSEAREAYGALLKHWMVILLRAQEAVAEHRRKLEAPPMPRPLH